MARDRVTELRRVRAGDLEAHPDNWRGHPENQQAALKGILEEVGWAGALIAYETGGKLRLVDGHLRAGMDPDEEVPVLILDVDDEEAAKLLVSLDPISAMAQADKEGLRALLDSVQVSDEGLGRMLADLARSAAPPRGEDTGPQEPPAEPKTKLGDMYRLGRHRLLCGDSTDESIVTQALGGDRPDVVFTDPPYGIEIVQDRHVGGGNVAPVGDYAPVIGDSSTDTAVKAVGLLKDIGRVSVFWGANYYADALPPSSCWLVWDKRDGMTSNNFADCELAWTSMDKPARVFSHLWAGMLRGSERTEKRVHPTQKPVDLASWVFGLVDDADLVLDPFAGSGSSLIAAERDGLRWVGLELAPAYCDVVVARWESYTGEKAELL